MSNATVFLILLIVGGIAFAISYFVMRKVASYTNGSLRKSRMTDHALELLMPKVHSSIQHSQHIHDKIKTIH